MSIAGDVLPVGDAAVLAVVGDTIDEGTAARAWALHAAALRAFGSAALDVVPAYASVLVRFDPCVAQLAIAMATMRGALEQASASQPAVARHVDIGVCFSPEYALDLEDVAAALALTAAQVIEEFCRPTYRVAFLGFSAGFPYLLGLSDKLHLPRLPTPRVKVPAGSVAFAAGQCGIYPRNSPGGWRIVGKTAATMFDPVQPEPALLRPGDSVVFHPVDSLDHATAVIR
ncbi:MAG: 5-oxoprolinase subunit PxpB [Candidatus Eremiobacteraeota bacterium]|nr:5-oxoprolinase subunit PxpB [Candidatus Eremiobacteraeota bacterium]